METIRVNASKSYDVIIGADAVALLGKKIKEMFPTAAACIVSDSTVAKLHMQTVRKSLDEYGIRNVNFTFEHGEASKNPDTLFEILEFLAQKHFTRKDVVVAFGGGVTGDIAGLAAAMFMRGIHLIQIPTSLLAMVDSSVGGKTAVNLKSGKNLAGVFNQPELVLCDTKMLDTLPRPYFNDGIAEVIKYGVVADKKLFKLISEGNPDNKIEEIIARCVKIKRDIVNTDEFDNGDRQILNFGHTIGHSIEKVSGYKISHGSAIAVGMVMMSDIADKYDFSEENCCDEIIDALLENNLPIGCPYSAKEIFHATVNDKKCSGEKISLVVPVKIGECKIKEVTLSEFEDMLY